MDAAAALCRTYLAYRRLGGSVREGPDCRAIRFDAAPLVYDSNYLEIDPGGEIDAALAFQESVLADRAHRQVVTTPFSDPRLAARLAYDGYRPSAILQALLPGELAGPAPRPIEIRGVVDEADWAAFDALAALLDREMAERTGNPDRAPGLAEQIQAVRRANADRVDYVLAWEEGAAVGFLHAWPGVDGVGLVEDLFTRPDRRNRGIARALIHACVARARARGARAVLIGSDPEDIPKSIYARMGFEATCLTWNWLRTTEPTVASPG